MKFIPNRGSAAPVCEIFARGGQWRGSADRGRSPVPLVSGTIDPKRGLSVSRATVATRSQCHLDRRRRTQRSTKGEKPPVPPYVYEPPAIRLYIMAMQFCDGGPDVPDDLISAQLAGEVVFVVGAGVSRRVGLPLFRELVERVYARLGQAPPASPDTLADAAETDAWEGGEWDRTLGLLERRLVYPHPSRPEVRNVVREAVAEMLQPPRRASPAHRDILAISRDSAGRPRVVTTNFDTLFEQAGKAVGGVASSVGPGLATVGSPDFHGVMHIHGRIAAARLGITGSNLVLTSADFGEAYLRSGWASRFVYDLLRRYTLVFAGYAADDPPMRYMLEATEAGRLHFPDLRRAYAFAPFAEGVGSDEGSARARWRAKGLEPILYENRDQSHNNLYRSLSAWADCARDPGAWAAGEISRIAGVPFADASEQTRAKMKYLTTTMANTMVLSNSAGSPDWIECLIDQRSPDLLERDANIWFARRLADRTAVEWALSAQPTIKAIVARAARSHLVVSRVNLPEAMYRFWRLYVAAFGGENGFDGFDRLALRPGLKAGATDYFTIESVVEITRPRLQLTATSFRGFRSFRGLHDDHAEASEASLGDLCYRSFECQEWPPWREILAGWPQDADAEYRLLNALGRTLAGACELAREAGLIDPSKDQTSLEVQLVHELEPAEAAVRSSTEGQYGGHQRVDIDEDRRSFVPIVRLMSGLWRRLAGRDAHRARSIAISWMAQEFRLFHRLGYWAAAISDDGPVEIASEALGELSHTSFWLDHRSAEAARFWCGRWNSLPRVTRRTIEKHILMGPPDKLLWPEEQSDKRRRANFTRYRELARITTAGGSLSYRARTVLARLTECLENPPAQISVVEGLRQEMWFGGGHQGNPELVEEVPTEGLLERVSAIETGDPINQDGLWVTICRERPGDAAAALLLAGDRGTWPPERWRDYLNASLMAFKDGIDKDEITSVSRALCDMPADIFGAILPAASAWLRSLPHTTGEGMRDPILVTWDRLLTVLPSWADAHDRGSSPHQPLLDESVNHPAGILTEILVALQDRSPKAQAAGLAPDLQPRFEQVMRLSGRVQKLAIAPLVPVLPLFLWLAPDWAEEKLCQELDRDESNGRQLLSTLILYGRYYDVGTFNRLKAAITAALLDPQTGHDVRDRIAQFVTWAIGLKMGGDEDISLTEPEARRLLTRSPATALRSVAWGLWRTLSEAQPDDKGEVWAQHLKPFLERVWPNDVVARDPGVSRMLVKIPAVAGELVPEVVDLILRLIVPSKVNSVEFDFDLHDRPELLGRFPHEIFDLVRATIELDEPPPYDLARFLDDVVVAAPDLRDDAGYVAMRNRLQRF